MGGWGEKATPFVLGGRDTNSPKSSWGWGWLSGRAGAALRARKGSTGMEWPGQERRGLLDLDTAPLPRPLPSLLMWRAFSTTALIHQVGEGGEASGPGATGLPASHDTWPQALSEMLAPAAAESWHQPAARRGTRPLVWPCLCPSVPLPVCPAPSAQGGQGFALSILKLGHSLSLLPC